MSVVREIYALKDTLPKEEKYGLSDQMRRAAIAIPSNIAEGFGRSTAKDYAHFLAIAKGSAYELETQVEICIMQNYFPREQAKMTFSDIESVEKMLTGLSKSLISK